ncbi:YbgA family protein [Clostridium sp. 'White wine YQ']|uniref:YbgA family protein n=1 Tax=Clostridium sp. 'White wine YQ' TaxID=3027474 RepID=UPI002365D615|nr:DUF523 and DUF1722 domain-containing protein [Clostridium sp. 'White wine YQ']MDD7794455.1 DUF523 and DUF1722 domain-containing protein [Clostridium sp. 'White wine YQ']
MEDWNQPQLVVSRCLGFSKCRYNGQSYNDKFVDKLKDYVNYITVCPEVEIGLGTPRESLRLVKEKDKIELFQPTTEKVFTEVMETYSSRFLDSIKDIDGFILKGKSPSCGIKDVKIYLGTVKSVGTIKGAGIFAAKAMDKYPYLAIEEEGRLKNLKIREHFLTKVYTMYEFRRVIESESIEELLKFHSHNKFLFMAYNQKEQKVMGRILANHENKNIEEIMNEYREHLGLTFRRVPRYTSYINTLMKIFGHFSDEISSKEKEFILSTFDKYREEKIHLSVLVNLIRSYVIKYEEDYLINQSIWTPYPEGLLDISDSGKEGGL